MWDTSITSSYQNFPLLQQLQIQGTKKYIQFPCVLSKILCNQYTKFGKQLILNTVAYSGLRLHPIHLENSKSTGLFEKGEVRSLPTTARTPEIKTWLLLKAAHTPFLRGTELTRTAPLTMSAHVAVWEQSESAIATVTLCIIMVTMPE